MEQDLNIPVLLRHSTSHPKHSLSRLIRFLVKASAWITLSILFLLVGCILIKGIPALSPGLFSWTYTSENHFLIPALINTLIMVVLTLFFSVIIGIGAAVYLCEYCRHDSKVVHLVMTMTETLAGVPSIVFGLFGMLFFVKALHMQNCLLAGALTLAFMVLPLIIQSSREALLALPAYYREGSYGLGAGKLRTIFQILLPAALPGILSGVVLAAGRILGESAALIYTAGTIAQVAWNPLQPGATLSVFMYKLLNEGLFTDQACAVGVVLIGLAVLMSLLSLLLQKKAGKRMIS